MFENLAFLHVYPQVYPHGDLTVTGNAKGLQALANAVNLALEHGTAHGEAIASDGEGYRIAVTRVNLSGLLGIPWYDSSPYSDPGGIEARREHQRILARIVEFDTLTKAGSPDAQKKYEELVAIARGDWWGEV